MDGLIYEEGLFPDFVLPQELPRCNILGRQEILMGIIENGDDYIENPAMIDLLKEHEEKPTTLRAFEVQPKNQEFKQEDFEKVLADWQEHMQVTQAEETLFQELVSIYPELEGLQQEQDTGFYSQLPSCSTTVKEESISSVLPETIFADDIEIKEDIKLEINDNSIAQLSLPRQTHRLIEQNINTKKPNKNIKKKGIKKEIIMDVKQEEQEASIDIETIPDELPVLEAVDVTSLWEQFEATTENATPPVKPADKPIVKSASNTKPTGKKRGRPPKNGRKGAAKKSTACSSEQRKVVQNQLSQPKVRANISFVPPMESLMLMNSNMFSDSNQNITCPLPPTHINNIGTVSDISIHLDHDYCSNSLYSNSGDKICTKQKSSTLKSNQRGASENTTKTRKYNSTKQMVLNKMDDTSKDKIAIFPLPNRQIQKANSSSLKNDHKDCQERSVLKQSQVLNNSLSTKTTDTSSKLSSKVVTIGDMKIRSVLATKILKMRGDHKLQTPNTNTKQQMVSVLKKPLNSSQCSVLTSNFRESIVTTTNSSNNEIQNIIIENTEDLPSQKELKKPVRKKLNLEEYRNRRDQNCNVGNRTNSPASPMTLVYIPHASTTTEPIKDNNNKMIWCEREIIATVRSKLDVEQQRKKPKATTCDVAIQTYETVFEFSVESSLEEKNGSEKNKSLSSIRSRSRSSSKGKNNKRKRSKSRSRSRSRSRSKSKRKKYSVSRSRSRSLNSSDSNKASRSEKEDRSKSRSGNSSDNNRSRYRSWKKSRNKRKNSRNRSGNSSDSKSTRSRSRTRSISRSNRNRSTSRSWKNSRGRNSNESKNRSSDRTTRSRSRSRRHSRTQSRQRQISRRRSSVSSSSSRSSSSRSRSWRSRSRSYQTSSRSSSRYQSSCSRSSSTSNFERSRWSSRRNSTERERNYNRCKGRSGSRHDRNWRRSPSHYYRRPYDNWYYREKQRQVDERRVIYVGRIESTITKADLRRRFEMFGPIVEISVHFRAQGDNYGFVTFEYRDDAYEAIEHGNDDPSLPPYDLCFGGRRTFCKVKYSDLDGMASNSSTNRSNSPSSNESFDFLLKQAMNRQRIV